MSPVRVNRKEILENLNLRIIYINMNIVQYKKNDVLLMFSLLPLNVYIYSIFHIYIHIYIFFTYLYTLKCTSAFLRQNASCMDADLMFHVITISEQLRQLRIKCCIHVLHLCFSRLYIYYQYTCSLGIEPTTFALLTQCSNH